MEKVRKSVWLVGHKDSAKKKDYLAMCVDEAEAKEVMAASPTATFIKEVFIGSR